jgi:ATPase family associated with various cellular activities (AAA)
VVDPYVRGRVVSALRDYTTAVARDPAPFRDASGRIPPPAVLLFGPPGEGKTQLAFDVAFEAFTTVVHLDCTSLVGTDPEPVLRRVIDTAVLRQAAIVFEDAHHLFRAGAAPRVLRALLAGCPACLLFTSPDVDLDAKLAELFLLRVEIEAPSSAARRRIWDQAFPSGLRTGSDLELDVLAERYRFDGRTIATTARLATARSLGNDGRSLRMTDVDDAAQLMLSTQMGSVARRLGGHYTFDDLVLPDEQRRQLQDIVDAGRSWDVVMSTWGFAERLASGKSLTALFWGKPGTGKSFAARIVANLLGKRLFAVNLDQIMSKHRRGVRAAHVVQRRVPVPRRGDAHEDLADHSAGPSAARRRRRLRRAGTPVQAGRR